MSAWVGNDDHGRFCRAALEAEMKAVKNSRDQFQAKNADLIKQVNYWRKRAEKAEKSAT